MKLYTYRAINEYLIDSLQNNYLYLNKVHKMNDPYEGAFDLTVSIDLIEDYYGLLKERLQMPDEMKCSIEQIVNDEAKANLLARIFESVAKKASNEHIGIYCFTQNKNSLPMWAHYANNHKGIMIEYDAENKVAQKAQPIIYKENLNDIVLSNKSDFKKLDTILYDSLTVKHSSWSYENEYRIRGREGYRIDYDNNFITGIYFGMHCSNDEKQKVIEASKHSTKIRYYNSFIMTGMYEVFYG